MGGNGSKILRGRKIEKDGGDQNVLAGGRGGRARGRVCVGREWVLDFAWEEDRGGGGWRGRESIGKFQSYGCLRWGMKTRSII